jgi:preprotein translocase subunit SecD
MIRSTEQQRNGAKLIHLKRLSGATLAAFCLITQVKADPVKLEVAQAHILPSQREDRAGIEYRLTEASELLFFKFSSKNLNKRMAIRVDGRVIASPVIRSAIPGGLGAMYLNLNQATAEELVRRLNSGEAKLEVEAVSA